ncbi:MAG: hypothetical protein AUJ20_07065 [Comamonadaceae bacterium CG1_02_60_18]|nr:MAG: hypothetical protein AUJ20_07065 [Comamonadaceae bacterium CG1_02_60_18]PIQ54907.1 MAG: hypothetical protein COW02_04590 [Comamonadaceae bacterium CG12_big_fil_rev_8_21_14_0_65_59_15]
MTLPQKNLIHKLAWVLLVKLVVLTGLWWAFFHDQRVAVDANLVSDQFLSTSGTSGNKGEQP